nr:hypothetical protein [Tanacetum cinerariifolium]
MAGNTVKDMTTNFGKLNKFEGHDFRRWQKKMHFLLTTLKVVYVLTTPMPELLKDATVEAIRIRAKWENDDYICRGHILNGMSDSLFDVYMNVESAKELWDSLESKYMAEDSSNDLSLVQLGSHLRIEESIRVQDSDNGKGKKVGGPFVNMTGEGKNKHNKQNNGKKRSNENNSGSSSNKNQSWNVESVARLVTSKKIAVVVDVITWWIDSGATTRVCKDRCWFKTFEPVEDGSILYMGDEHFAPVHGKGSVALEISSGKTVTLFNVLYVPKLCKNLVSGPVLNNCGYNQVYEFDKYILSKCGVFVGFGYYNNGMFMLNLNKVPDDLDSVYMSSSSTVVNTSLWHARLGHVHYKRMLEMSKDDLIPAIDENSKKMYYLFYVIEPNDSISINSIIESRDAIFDENRFSSIPRPKDIIPNVQESKMDDHTNDVPNEIPEPRKDPRTYNEAMQSRGAAFWKEAIDDEIGSIMENNTWVQSDLPPGCKPFGCKWIFKRKMKVDGSIDKFKGIDYFDTYAPVARITTIRLLLALADIRNLVIHQMDVKTTFLNDDLDKEVYMKQPKGFVMPGNEHKVCKLVKSLKFNNSGIWVIICLYVDDMLIFKTDQNQVDETKKFLSSRFSMKDMGEADVILDCSPVSTPIDPVEKLKPNIGKPADQLEYSRAIGCLMYAMTSTRPDIAYVVGRLMAAAGKEAEWLRNLIHEIPIWPKPITPISILCDSAPTMARAYSQIYNRKSRHLGVRHSMVRELIRNGVISIEFVRTQHNLADHLTKGLWNLVNKCVETSWIGFTFVTYTKMKGSRMDIDWDKVVNTNEIMNYVMPKYKKMNWIDDIYNTLYKEPKVAKEPDVAKELDISKEPDVAKETEVAKELESVIFSFILAIGISSCLGDDEVSNDEELTSDEELSNEEERSDDIASSKGLSEHLLKWYDDSTDEEIPKFKFYKSIAFEAKAFKSTMSKSKASKSKALASKSKLSASKSKALTSSASKSKASTSKTSKVSTSKPLTSSGPTAKGVGLRVADSRTGNHLEDDFTPFETIRRLCCVFGRSSYLGFEGETFEPKWRTISFQRYILFFSMDSKFLIASQTCTLTKEQLTQFVQDFDIPHDAKIILPKRSQIIFDAPLGYVGLYTHHFLLSNLRLPISSVICKVLNYFKVHISRFNPFGMVKLTTFVVMCRAYGSEPTMKLLRSFLNLGCAGNWLTLSNRGSANVPIALVKPITHLADWKGSFFYVENKIIPLDYPELLFESNKSDKKSFSDKVPWHLESDPLYHQIATYPCHVRTFPDPILYLAGLKTSWKHSPKEPVIYYRGHEMDFRSFMMQEIDGEFKFLSEDFIKDVADFDDASARDNENPLVGTSLPPLPEVGKKLRSLGKRKLPSRVGDSLLKVRKMAAQASKVAAEASDPLDVDSDHDIHASCDAIRARELEKDRTYAELERKGVLMVFTVNDRASVVAKVVLDAATKLIRSDEMGMLVAKHVKASIIYGRCAAFEEAAKLKEPFVMEKMAGYRPSSKQEYDQAGDDLANASYPFLSKYVNDPYASLEKLLSEKPESLRSKPSPAMSASYSASFPAPKPSKLEAPSVNSFYVFSGSGSFLLAPPSFSSSLFVDDVSTRKSASICPLIEFLPLNSISCSFNTMAYLVRLEISSELPCRVHKGKYEFSNSGYFCSAPFSVRLTKYTGACFFPLSSINTALTFLSEATRYTVKVSPLAGITIASKKYFIRYLWRFSSPNLVTELLLPPTLLLECGQLRFFLGPGFSSFVFPVLIFFALPLSLLVEFSSSSIDLCELCYEKMYVMRSICPYDYECKCLRDREEDFFGLSKLSLRSFETPLVATSLASTQVYVFLLGPSQNLQGVISVSGNEDSGAIIFLLFDVMYIQMCLCEFLLLSKVRSELCFEIFVVKDATCLLTIPPYSGGVFEGICEHRTKGVTEPKGFGKRPVGFRLVEGTCPPCGRFLKLPPIAGFLSEFAEGTPWAVH